MTLSYPRAFGPGVREILGDEDLVEIGVDDGVSLLRPTRAARALLVQHQRPPDTTAVLDEADRLSWLTGRGPAPELVGSGRADEGDETIVTRLAIDAVSAGSGHPMGPEALVAALAAGLRALHELGVSECPLDASTAVLRAEIDDRLRRGEPVVAASGPYAGRPAAELAALFDERSVVADPPAPVFIHGGLRADRVWFDPSGAVTFTGWRRGGVGDRHLDLAAAAEMVTDLHGPALVAPLIDAYGYDLVEPTRLDAHQLLAHLLR